MTSFPMQTQKNIPFFSRQHDFLQTSVDLAFIESSSKMGQQSPPVRQVSTSMKDHHPILPVRASD